jgi:hypothetical protein
MLHKSKKYVLSSNSEKNCILSSSLKQKCIKLKSTECIKEFGRVKKNTSDLKKKIYKKCSSEKKCCKLLYSIAAWADATLTNITYYPRYNGDPLVWSTRDGSLTSGGLFNGTQIKGQMPIRSVLFPLKICEGDRFEFTYANSIVEDPNPPVAPNAIIIEYFTSIAVAANLGNDVIKSFKPSLTPQSNQLILTAKSIDNKIIDPNGTPPPMTESSTANVVNTPNYVTVSSNIAINNNIICFFTVVWTPEF